MVSQTFSFHFIIFLYQFWALQLCSLVAFWECLWILGCYICLIQSSCAQQWPAAMYSASAVERATEFCFFEAQDTKDLPKNWQVPDVLFLLILQPAQSASE
jgi:hypothetical protein